VAIVAGAGLLALALGLPGCGGTPSATRPPARSTSDQAATLAQVEQDMAGVDAAAAQADTDVAAGEAAQAQNDNP